MATLAALLRGERSAAEEAAGLGLLVRREGDEVLELSDVDGRRVLGFLSTRGGIVAYHVDGENMSFELAVIEDSSVLESIPLEEVVEREEGPKPLSVWLHAYAGGSRGRICVLAEGVARCKPL